MISPPSNELWRLWGLTVCFLAFLAVALGFNTVRVRVTRQAFAAPEDFGVRKQDNGNRDVARANRVHHNALEQYPLFLLAALAYIHTNPAESSVRFFFGAYCLGRLVHIFWYSNGLPHRGPIAFGPPTFVFLGMLYACASNLW